MRIVSSSAAWLLLFIQGARSFSSIPNFNPAPFNKFRHHSNRAESIMKMSSASSWSDLQVLSASQAVGKSLNDEVKLRQSGHGSAHVQSTLRLFDANNDEMPKLTLYRDHAGWCPYCQKTMLLIEEKKVPINIGLVPMRSYGDKPREFMQLVPNGLLPALGVEQDDSGRQQIITESQVIMELLDRWHPPSDGYKAMLPADDDDKGMRRYDSLARLERELFSWWCTFMFRPEGPPASLPGGLMARVFGNNNDNNNPSMSGSMKGFLDCLSKVDEQLTATPGPWFFGEYDYPTMIDFVYVSHVERMLASCAFWKGLNIRGDVWKNQYPGINAWLEAFEKRESYLAFKSDYYTHVMDIPPQYGPSFNGGLEETRPKYAKMINGRDLESWHLPLPFDDPLQPLYKGPPLPLNILKAAGIESDNDGTYEHIPHEKMAKTCRQMAGWKLSGNGANVAKFAARGGSLGARNPRKNFGAELADPYAEPDISVQPQVEHALSIICETLLDDTDYESSQQHYESLQNKFGMALKQSIPAEKVNDVKSSLAYLRDRVGVPRDLPLAAARHLRAHLNWAIDIL